MGRLVIQRASLDVPSEPVRIAVVADTHSSPHPQMAERLREIAPHAILHGGDIGDLAVLDDLRAYAPLFAVRGNIDSHARELPDVLLLDLGPLRVLLTHIAVYGPKLRSEIAKLAREEGAKLVVCGHSHVPFIGVDKGIAVFNPGSIGPRRLTLPIVMGTIDMHGSQVRLQHLEAATGRPWQPPG